MGQGRRRPQGKDRQAAFHSTLCSVKAVRTIDACAKSSSEAAWTRQAMFHTATRCVKHPNNSAAHEKRTKIPLCLVVTVGDIG